MIVNKNWDFQTLNASNYKCLGRSFIIKNTSQVEINV